MAQTKTSNLGVKVEIYKMVQSMHIAIIFNRKELCVQLVVRKVGRILAMKLSNEIHGPLLFMEYMAMTAIEIARIDTEISFLWRNSNKQHAFIV